MSFFWQPPRRMVRVRSWYETLMAERGGVHDAGSAVFEFTPTGSDLADWYALAVDNALQWVNEGWGGHVLVCLRCLPLSFCKY